MSVTEKTASDCTAWLVVAAILAFTSLNDVKGRRTHADCRGGKPRTKVQELLTLVEAKQHGLYAKGYLNYGGVPLRASRSLVDYGIQNHATLDLSRRLHGGCFGFSILLWIIIFICCLISVCTCGLSLPVALCLLPPALLLPLCCL
ncbi:Ubiquitin-related domain [Phytophthora cactorum]|nr:Ubiquitin-related domain [Phytophthora cactorum]